MDAIVSNGVVMESDQLIQKTKVSFLNPKLGSLEVALPSGPVIFGDLGGEIHHAQRLVDAFRSSQWTPVQTKRVKTIASRPHPWISSDSERLQGSH